MPFKARLWQLRTQLNWMLMQQVVVWKHGKFRAAHASLHSSVIVVAEAAQPFAKKFFKAEQKSLQIGWVPFLHAPELLVVMSHMVEHMTAEILSSQCTQPREGDRSLWLE